MLSKIVARQLLRSSIQQTRQSVRHGGHDTKFFYREAAVPENETAERIKAHFFGFLIWFPALLSAYIDPGKLYATRRAPFPVDFTDEELGVPVDDEGLAPVKENPTCYKTGSILRPENFIPYLVKKKYGVTPYEA